VHRLLHEKLLLVGQDVLQPAWVSLMIGRKSFLYLAFSGSSSAE
jgi:hypothetical protein